jgi:hypothetical protein
MVVRACNPSTQEAETGGLLSLRTAWATQQDLDSRKKEKKKNKKSIFNAGDNNNIMSLLRSYHVL